MHSCRLLSFASREHLERWEKGAFHLVAAWLPSKFLPCTMLLQHPAPTVLQGKQQQLSLVTISDDFSVEGLP